VESKPENFIDQIIQEDLALGFDQKLLRFRFPPEPNGYLHIGHAKAIGLNFGLGQKYNSPVNLRFDDTNPENEELEYVKAIKEDVSWLGYRWANETYSSDNFQQLYEWAVLLIKKGKAYIDSQPSEKMAEQKGTPTTHGTNSPFRNREVEENLAIFEEMKNGDHDEGVHVLRAKIDMSHPNMLMRDPIIYRVLNKPHHRTEANWKVYPMYDWAHGQCDYIEQVSHSLCSLEFKPHRDLYDWFIEVISQETESLTILPKQREFARLNLSYTIMSKRKLAVLVEKGLVEGWDDPRMPTISGLRRRGYTPKSIREFINKVGVAKRENVIDVSLLEFCVREDLNKEADRKMVVLDPIKLTITNYPDNLSEELESEDNPEKDSGKKRNILFSKHLYIEREDFKEEANKKFFRLTVGKEVRLKSAYIIKGTGVVKDDLGNIAEILCEYDPKSKSGSGTEESLRKVKGTLHWVTQKDSINITVNSYDRLFKEEAPGSNNDDFLNDVNPDSLKIIQAKAEPSLVQAVPGNTFQFQRKGYFTVDKKSNKDTIVFNKTVGLRDSWKK